MENIQVKFVLAILISKDNISPTGLLLYRDLRISDPAILIGNEMKLDYKKSLDGQSSFKI
jgi:hypothetical protein